jgi:hypothetical protein
MLFFLKVLLAAIVIAFASWLSGKKPELSGFIIALPLASLIALVFSYLEHKNPETSITFAKSILVGVPISYLFFLGMNFWLIYAIGVILLVIGFILHRYIVSLF